jgi:hypothetical protein
MKKRPSRAFFLYLFWGLIIQGMRVYILFGYIISWNYNHDLKCSFCVRLAMMLGKLLFYIY